MVAGISTDVGKTLVSGILALLFQADYWKPIQCSEEDLVFMEQWAHKIHPSAYALKAPLSPHHAARLENLTIAPQKITIPATDRTLIIEGVGGVLVPLTTNITTLDLFHTWDCQWVIVSKHYLGSINHTLLTVEALKQRNVPILGLIFNGEPNLDSEAAILETTKLPCLGRLLPEAHLNKETLQRYAKQWQHNFG
jgi:dethiobiotin synthetase